VVRSGAFPAFGAPHRVPLPGQVVARSSQARPVALTRRFAAS
jgi:hypothetical protein